MKYQKIKIVLIALCVFAAGICYVFGRSMEDQKSKISLEEVPAFQAGEAGDSGQAVTGEEPIPDETGVLMAQKDGPESAGDKVTLPFYIHICGEVVSPGVYELSEGSRVFQAVEKAGGFTDQAASEYLNMAERIADGMKIVVLNREEAEAAKALGERSLPADASSNVQKRKVNLNTATKEELMTLRGIGEAKADDILKYRESRGGFRKIEDIMKISGIKDAAFQKIKEDITV